MSLKSKLSLSTLIAFALVLFPAMAFAADDAAANKYSANAWLAGGAALAICVAALGGTLSQGRATAAALEGISRNPGAAARIQTPMILGLALIESLVLLSFVIAYFLQGKIAI